MLPHLEFGPLLIQGCDEVWSKVVLVNSKLTISQQVMAFKRKVDDYLKQHLSGLKVDSVGLSGLLWRADID